MKPQAVKMLLVMLSVLALFVAGFAQENPKPTDKPQTQDKSTKADKTQTTHHDQMSKPLDHEFAMKAAKDGMAEVELGQLATTKASNDDVKTFAQRMVDDHSKANDELKNLAATKGITLPTALDATGKKMVDDLSKLSGADFDRKYMEMMVKDHDKAVALFEKQATSGKDVELKAWADKTLPTLREHQKMARDTAAKVGAKLTPAK
ncbi:MAG: DUF4142 domain-containing protein [Acidobacteriota bacterium]